MNNIYLTKLNEIIIIELKPIDFGRVEDELTEPPLRTQEWYHKNGDLIKDPIILNEWLAIKGWVCQCFEEADHEGSDYHIIIAYLVKDKLYQKYFKIGYDSYHWAMSYPEHNRWFHQTFKPSQSLTLLIHPDNHDEVEIFGQFEAFIKKNGKLNWCAH